MLDKVDLGGILKSFTWVAFLFLAITMVFIVPLCSAHVPKEIETNENFETAFHIEDPTKSWVIYSEIHEGGEGNYYKLELDKGQILRLSLFIPNKDNFLPVLVVAGPSLESNDTLPEAVKIPEDMGYVVLEGKLKEPEFEPFTPASYYYLVDYEEEVDHAATYYVAVFEPDSGGKYGLAVGKEERYSVLEWIRIPIDVINIRQWEGKSLLLLFSPLILTLVGGVLFFVKKIDHDSPKAIIKWLVIFSGLLYLGSGFTKFTELGFSINNVNPGPLVIITIIFSSLPIILGIFTIRLGVKMERDTKIRDRVRLAIYGILALFLWAGLIFGSIIIFLASILPSDLRKNKKENN